jgi:DNA-binding HxlR family transcriptional regulator
MRTEKGYDDKEEANGNSEERIDDLIIALSNRTSLRIFRLASRGPIASKTIREKLDISDSVCHERLRHLIDLGLLMKVKQQEEEHRDGSRREGVYTLTPLGQIVYQTQVVRLYDIAAQNNRFEVLAKIIEKNSPVTEIQSVAMKQLQTEFVERIENSVGLSNLKPIKFFRRLEDYTYHIRECMRNATSELYLATRSLDFATIQILANLGQRKRRSYATTTSATGVKNRVKISVIYSELDYAFKINPPHQNRDNAFTSRISYEGDVTTDYSRDNPFLFSGFKNNPYFSIQKVTKINWSFLAVDKEVAALEITASKDFVAGFVLENEEVAARLVSYYQEMVAKQEGRPKIIDSLFALADIELTPTIN